MPEIINAIQERNYELVRDRIANILAIELPSQATLNSDADLDPTIEIERFVPVKDTELPLVNVMLLRGDYNSYTSIQQDGTYMYHIDVYTNSKWTDDDRADKLAFLKLQRLTGVIQAILSDSKYRTLGWAQPSISRVQVNGIKFAEPSNNKDTTTSVMARIEFEVRVPETVEVAALTLIGGYDTSVLIGSTDQGYVFSGNNAPIPAPSCDPAEVRNTDDTYTDTYPSGEISTIPNTLAVIEDTAGNELSNNDLPSAKPGGYKLVAPDANITVKNSNNDTVDSGTALSGGNAEFDAPDAVARMENTVGTLLLTENIPSNVTETLIAPDAQISLNGDSFPNIPSGTSANIEVRQSTGSVEIGAKQGQHFRIPDSVITVDSAAFTTLKATDPLDVKVVDADGNTLETTLSSPNIEVFLLWYQLAVLAFRQRVLADGGTLIDHGCLTTKLIDTTETRYNALLAFISANELTTGLIHAVKPNDGTVDLTVDRLSAKTVIDEDGVVITIADDVSPISYPYGGKAQGCPFIWDERQATNVNPNSLDQKTWSGYNTIYGVTEFASGGFGDLPYALLEKLAIGTVLKSYTANSNKAGMRVFVRNISQEVRLLIRNNTAGVNLSDLKFDSSYNIIGTPPTDFEIINTNDNGWYEVKLFALSGITVGDQMLIYLMTGSNPSVGETFEVCQVDFIEDDVIGSPIITTGSVSTRLQDTLTTTPPAGTTKIIEHFTNGTTNEITTIPATYEVSEGEITKIEIE